MEMIEIEGGHTAPAYLDAFWRWVTLMAQGDYDAAADGLFLWEGMGREFDPSDLREHVEQFFGGPDPWSVVVPNERLVDKINGLAEIELARGEEPGYLVTLIPVTTQPEDPKDDEIPLAGVGVQMVVRDVGGASVLGFGIWMA